LLNQGVIPAAKHRVHASVTRSTKRLTGPSEKALCGLTRTVKPNQLRCISRVFNLVIIIRRRSDVKRLIRSPGVFLMNMVVAVIVSGPSTKSAGFRDQVVMPFRQFGDHGCQLQLKSDTRIKISSSRVMESRVSLPAEGGGGGLAVFPHHAREVETVGETALIGDLLDGEG